MRVPGILGVHSSNKMKKKLVVAAILAALLGLVVTAYAQFGAQFGQFGGGRTGGGFGGNVCMVPGSRNGNGEADTSFPRNINRAGFVYARVRYHLQPWRGGEVPWHHDYPDGDTMFPDNLGKLTTVATDPNSYQIVDIDSKELFQYPFIYMSEPGYLNLLPADVKNLREYFDRGGFLLMDDFRANDRYPEQYLNMQLQMSKVFPDRMIETVSPNHPIFHTFFDLDPKDMLAPYTQAESGPVEFLAISDDKGRIQVMIDFNNDISEYWQALDVGQCSIHESGRAVQLGINYAIYAMTH
jgi:hypothetical protein